MNNSSAQRSPFTTRREERLVFTWRAQKESGAGNEVIGQAAWSVCPGTLPGDRHLNTNKVRARIGDMTGRLTSSGISQSDKGRGEAV